jgi:hypothetical protein
VAPDRTADELLAYAGELLNAAAAGEQTTRYAALALETVLATADHPDVSAVSQAAITRLEAAFDAAVGAVIEDTGDALGPVRVSFGMGCGRSLLQFFGRPPEDLASERHRLPELGDRLDHTALLAHELEALLRKRRIDARGNHLELAAAMHLGLTPEAGDDVQFH